MRSFMTGLRLGTLRLSAALLASPVLASTTLPALNSYSQPPFVLPTADPTAGLAAAFVGLLNEQLAPGSQLQLENLPRRRLELELTNRGFSGIALFLAPEFLAAPVQQGGAWSIPVMVDENLLVSVRPLKLSTLDDLRGLRLGGIAGHIYRQLVPLIDDGRLEREDAVDHIANLKKLCLGRIDVIVISRSELAGTEPLARCAHEYRPMAFPEPQVIVRRVLVRMPGHEGAQPLLGAIASVACGDRWGAALAAYRLSTVGCLHGGAGRSSDTPPPVKARRQRAATRT
ncbi:hypothetical protein [Roseateles asaccharophilus]|uniref:Polar amino acid transport system substrate-binding protein n=1 Tax=Roseateles asaccharophilus TaxID=582607 RepID=A0ABU2AFU0_9BURK|nr:hypothetical protein [Roseateles asaccharophilus]MDR7336044.1 polar amino acid transport system substrate-binding protein [Roseateles asaccharophilus]